MTPTTTEQDLALRTSLSSLLLYTTQGMESALDVAAAIAAALATVHNVIAEFACESNKKRAPVLWCRLPAELKLETTRWLPPMERATMLGVSRDIRRLLLIDTSLWTCISEPRRFRSRSDRVEFLQVMLSRTGSRPLDLEWRERCAYDPESADPVRDIILSVLPRTWKLSLHEFYFRPGLNSFWTVSTPLLAALAVTIDPESNNTRTTISRLLWNGNRFPRLRSLRLGAVCFDGLPDQALTTVVHLEAAVGFHTNGKGWACIWAWFPRLESIVVRLTDYSAPAVPSPPQTLRHVTLHVSTQCGSPSRFLGHWASHAVKHLEVFSSTDDTLHWALDFLAQCEPVSQWTASLTMPCCETREWPRVAAVRGKSLTVIVRPGPIRAIRNMTRTERVHAALSSRLETLHLEGLCIWAMLEDGAKFPRLRSLTISNTRHTMPLKDVVEMPQLEQLTVDLSIEDYAHEKLPHVPEFVAGIKHDQRLQDVTIRLPASFDRQHPALAQVSADLALDAQQVRIEYAPAVRGHEFPCPLHRPSGE